MDCEYCEPLPAEVKQALGRKVLDRWTGGVMLHMRDGVIVAYEERVKHRVLVVSPLVEIAISNQ